jgi:hypothetical protein
MSAEDLVLYKLIYGRDKDVIDRFALLDDLERRFATR